LGLMVVTNEAIMQCRGNPVQQIHRGRLKFFSAFRGR
jgi:hypothetical protein